MDLNQDGNLDILSGSYSRMDEDKDMAGLFQVLWGEAKPDGTSKGKFREPQALLGTDDQPLIVGDSSLAEIDEETASDQEVKAYLSSMTDSICTRPTAADINGDGHLDLVVGNATGNFHFFVGEGKGKFAPISSKLKSGKDELRVPFTSDPCIVDWDQDGDLDILSGSRSGGVFLSTNIGGKTNPDFLPFTSIIDPIVQTDQVKFGDSHIKGPQGSTRVAVADINEDGKLDIIVGDTVDLTFPAEGLMEAEVSDKLNQWNNEMSKIQSQIQPKQEELFEQLDSFGIPKDSDDQETIAEREKLEEKLDSLFEGTESLYEERAEIVREESVGSVWVYYQK